MKFYEEVIKIDELLYLSSLNTEDLKRLKNLLGKVSVSNYFWRNLKQHDWLPILKESGFFEILSQKSRNNIELYQTQSFISDYLLLAAEKYPNQTIEIIRSVNTDNDRVIWNFVKIGLSIPPSDTAELVPIVTRWIGRLNMRASLFDSEIIKWVEHLSNGEFEAAFNLLKILVTPKLQKPSRAKNKKIDEVFGVDRPKSIPAIQYYYLKQLLSKELRILIESDSLKLCNILQRSLEKSIKIEYGHIKGGFDLSYVWRPAIEDHPQNYEHYELKDAILVALRESTEALVKRDKEAGLKVVREYLSHQYSIFRRLAIHLLRLNYDIYPDFTNDFIRSEKLLSETDISHEYYILLRDIFQKLNIADRNVIVRMILENKKYDKAAKHDDQQKQIRYNHFKKLHYIKNYLEENDKIYFDKLEEEFKGEKLRDTNVWHESYHGENSPLTLSEIETKDLSELWNIFRNFRKTGKSFDDPTTEGLAMTFGAAVKKNPYKYLGKDLRPLAILKPSYSYWFINEVNELFRSEKYTELNSYIENLLDYINLIIRIENVPERLNEERGIDFTGVKKRSLDFVQLLLKSQQKDLNQGIKDKIWEIIEYLCYYKWDPENPDELSESNTDPYTVAINSVRGTALISVIDYALCYASENNNEHSMKYSNRLIGEERVQILLDHKLKNKQEDPSLAIHSVFGVYFANLAYINYEWAKENIDFIFPNEKDKEYYWMTAWSGFINASRFYSDLFELLKPQFTRALEYLTNGIQMIQSGFGRSAEDALSEHLIVACLNGIDDILKQNSLLRRFALIPNNPSTTHAAQFIANLGKDENIFRELPGLSRKSFWPQAKEFWKIRLAVAKEQVKDKKRENEEDEYDREFSRYISWLDDLPEEVTLKELEPLLIKTIKLNQRGWQLPDFIEYLSKQSQNYPLISIKLLKHLMQTQAPRYFFSGKEKEIEQILQIAINTGEQQAFSYADYIINRFGEWGNYYFKELWITHFRDQKIKNRNTLNRSLEQKARQLSKLLNEYFRITKKKQAKPKDVMPFLIEMKFFKVNNAGLPLRNIFRELERSGKLYLLPQVVPQYKKRYISWLIMPSENG